MIWDLVFVHFLTDAFLDGWFTRMVQTMVQSPFKSETQRSKIGGHKLIACQAL